MNYIKNIVKSILAEEANIEGVSDAIKKHYEVEVDYYANDTEAKSGKGKRVIQPVALGHSKSGNLIVRAFQPYGDTKTTTPHWKTFRLDRFGEWKPLKKRRFQEPPDFQYNAEGSYNDNGDKTMTDVLIQANFSGTKAYNSGEGKYKGLKQHNDELVKKKVEQNPYYNLQKNIEKSYNANNIDYIRRNIEAWKNSEAAKQFRQQNYQQPNQSSIEDMQKITDFGDTTTQQTVGPVAKDNLETKQQNNRKLDYSQAKMNGPQLKQNINNKEQEDLEDNENNG